MSHLRPRIAGACVCVLVACIAPAAMGQGVPRSFEVQEGSELRVWLTMKKDGEVQPPSIGQPAAASPLSGWLDGSNQGTLWTFEEAELSAEDTSGPYGLYPLSEIVLSLPFENVEDPDGLYRSVDSFTGIEVPLTDRTVLNFADGLCTGCSDFALALQFRFGTLPNGVAIVVPVGFFIGVEDGKAQITGVVSEGFEAIFQGQPGGPISDPPLALWIELELDLIEVPVEPTDVGNISEGNELRLYQTTVVKGEAQKPPSEQKPDAVSAFSGGVATRQDDALWTFTLVDLAAEDVSLTLPVVGDVELRDIALTMPFEDALGSDGMRYTISLLSGLEDGDQLRIDETACEACTDFAAALGFTLEPWPASSFALMGPLELQIIEEPGATTLRGTLSRGFVLDVGTEVGLWLEADVDLVFAPEPATLQLYAGALLGIVLLRRRAASARR